MGKLIRLEHGGRSLTFAEWAAVARENPATPDLTVRLIRMRVNVLGWSIGKAISEPASKVRTRKGGRPRGNVPRPCPPCKRHPSGRAYARWKMHGRTHERYFGPDGSQEAAAAYRRFSAEWATGSYERSASGAGLTCVELAASWLRHCRDTYRKDGAETSEVPQCKRAAECLADLYGDARAADFTPDALRACRAVFVGKGYARNTCNAYTARIVRAFQWGAGNSLVPVAIYSALKLVEPLAAGRTTAPDRPRKRPATEAQIAATLPKLCPADPARAKTVAAMIQLQRLTGMRPGEVCALRPCEVDRAGDVWRHEVGKANKNRHRGKRQAYYFGPRAIAILTPHLAGAPEQPAFGLGRDTYSVSVRAAAVRAGVTPWTPHQLRHALATEVARRFGSLDHAAAAIGDSAAVAAAVYVHLDPRERAKIEVAKEMG